MNNNSNKEKTKNKKKRSYLERYLIQHRLVSKTDYGEGGD